ncbi:7 transmembrane receptor (rhodopsin family) domain-containing protein [Ditylenchus destructor]|nr:7 transmembrane receptor (rhodopsin family) domain-containing protein [Ditylenchus destructor]
MTITRTLFKIVVMDNTILEINFYFCDSLTAIWVCAYRTGQVVALLIALDRLVAIYKPVFYSQRQGNVKTVTLFAIISAVTFFFLLFAFMYGADSSRTELAKCSATNGPLYSAGISIYSTVVSVAFFAAYLTSLILFTRHLRKTKAHNFQSEEHISRLQLRLFSTISIVLIFYTIFFVIPTIMQLSYDYFGVGLGLVSIANHIITYGSLFDGVINVAIYLIKHQEFRECNKRLFYSIMGKADNKGQASEISLATVKVMPVRSVLTSTPF